jgi:translocation and assembly module TamB
MEDEKQDTLVYSKDLEVSVALLPLIKGDKINVKSVEWNGLKTKIYRPENGHDFNYSFLIEAFIPTDTTTAAPLARDRPEIVIGKISLSNIDLSYNDEVTRIMGQPPIPCHCQCFRWLCYYWTM